MARVVSSHRAGSLAATALVALALATAAPAAAPPRWKRVPASDFLCSRYGPDWTRGKGGYPDVVRGAEYAKPFKLTLPPGHALKFRLQAVSGDGGPVRYETRGWPAGAALDPASGKFSWKVAGKPGQTFKVVFEAVSGAGGRASWTMVVAIASEARQLIWSAGLGGKPWPSCPSWKHDQKLLVQDLDDDGAPDVMLSREWSLGDPQGHMASSYELVLRQRVRGRPDRGRRIAWDYSGDDGFQGEITVQRAVGGVTLLRVVHHACAGGSPVAYLRIVKGKPVTVGSFDPVDKKDSSGYSELDDGFKVEPQRNAAGEVVALLVTSQGTTRRHAWRRGRFRPEAFTAASSDPAARLLDLETADAGLGQLARGLIARGIGARHVATQLNTRGMRLYKRKQLGRAAAAFELAHATDPRHELPIYNRACVAGLQRDAAAAAAWLGKLKQLGTGRATKLLRGARRDRDFTAVRGAAAFKAVVR